MQEPSPQLTALPRQALLQDAALARAWALEPRRSSIRLKSSSMWGLAPVNGVFRPVSGNGSAFPDGKVSGTLTAAAASIDTKNTRRDAALSRKHGRSRSAGPGKAPRGTARCADAATQR
jgi:hypothetical protein